MSNPSPEPDSVDLRPLPGSEPRSAPRAIQAAGPVPADTTIEITLVMRRRGELPDPAAAAPIPASALAADYGADPADVDLVTATVTALGARVLSVHPAARLVRIEGTAAAHERDSAFAAS